MSFATEIVDWLTKAFGVVRVEEAAAYAEIDNELTALAIPRNERAEVFAAARVIAQSGVDIEEAVRAVATGAVDATFGMMHEVVPLRQMRDHLRAALADTPDIREPDLWWPLGDDGDEFKRGARWSENWWRQHIEKALEMGENR